MNWLKEVNVINNNDTSDLVKRVDYNKINEIEKKITDPDHEKILLQD